MQICGLSEHAQMRMQQRGIPPVVLDCLLEFGHAEHDHRGGRILYFDKEARRRLESSRDRKALAALEKHLNTYAVLAGDGTVTTVGHRYRRIPRP